MGTLRYGSREIPIDDRLLTHLSAVITQKLRRREAFLLTLASGERHLHCESLWISATSDLTFAYSGNRLPSVDHEWLERMMTESFSTHGLDLTTQSESSGQRPVGSGSGSGTLREYRASSRRAS